jgi:hypothetical protein
VKEIFPEYYYPTKRQIGAMWKKCTFVLDTNVLLNLYRYSEDTKNNLISILTSNEVSGRLWIPYQVVLEYQKNRANVIVEKANVCNNIKGLFDQTKKELDKILSNHKEHPFLNRENIRGMITEIEIKLEKSRTDYMDLLYDDILRERLGEILKAKIGEPYDDIQLEEIYKKGQSRYDEKIPPGFMHEGGTKKKQNLYGDLILWFQIIEYAKKKKSPIIFVTDDAKKDWWQKANGENVGPRPELVREIHEMAKVKFHMYLAAEFMNDSNKYLKEQKVEQEAIEEAREVRKQEERKTNYRDIRVHVDALPLITEAFRKSQAVYNTSTIAASIMKLMPDPSIIKNITDLNKITGDAAKAFIDLAKVPASIYSFRDKLIEKYGIEAVRHAISSCNASETSNESPPQPDGALEIDE